MNDYAARKMSMIQDIFSDILGHGVCCFDEDGLIMNYTVPSMGSESIHFAIKHESMEYYICEMSIGAIPVICWNGVPADQIYHHIKRYVVLGK